MHDQVWQAALPVLCLDAELHITVWNSAASQETGLATVEAVGRRLQDIFPVQSGTLAQLQTAEERSYVLDFPSQSAEKRLQLHLLVCRDEALSGFIGFAAPDASREREDNVFSFNEKVERLPLPCFSLNTGGEIVEWNHEMAALTRTRKEEVLGQTFLNFVESSCRPSVSDLLSSAGGSVETGLRSSRACAGLDVILNVLPKSVNTEGVLCIVHDITALKASVAASACVAKEMRRIIDDSTQAILGIDAHGLVNEWNSAAAELFGFSRLEVFGKALAALDFGAGEVAKALELALEGQPMMQHAAWHKGGKRHELILHVQPREVGGAICLVQERTAGSQGELPKVEVALRQVADSVPIIGLDSGCCITFWNGAAETMSGYSEVEMVGKSLADILLTKGDAEGLDMMLCEGLDGKETHGLMCDMLSKEGEARRLRLNAMPYSDEPQPRGVIVVVQDITERMLPELQTLHPAEAEAAVKEMHMLIDETFVPIWGTDRDWKITVWNPKMVEVTGLSAEEALAKPLLSLDIFAQAEEMSNALRQFFSGEIGGMRAMRKDVVLIAGDKHLQAEIAILPRGISKDAEVLIVANLNAGLQSATNESQGEVEDWAKWLHCVPIVAVNCRGEVIEWNDKVSMMTGRELKEVFGRSVEDVLTQGHEVFRKAIELGLKGQEDFGEFDVGLRGKRGEEVILKMSGGIFRDADGQMAGVVAGGQDVTSIRKSMQMTASVAEDLQRLIDSTGAPIFGIDRDGRVNLWNGELVQISGSAKEEIINFPLVNFISADFQEDVNNVLQQALLGKKVTNFEFELAKHGAQQRGRRILAAATPRRDNHGEVVGVFGVGQDITELRDALAEQKGLAEDLSYVFETANAFICGVCTNGLVVGWNRKAAELTGFCKEEAVGKAVKDFIRSDFKQEVSRVLSKAFDGEETANFELIVTSKEAEDIELLLNATPRKNARGDVTGAICVGQEITSLRKAMDSAQQVADDLTSLIDTANAPIFGIDIEGRVSEWNRKVAALTGFDKQEALGCNLVETFVAETHREEIQKILEKALKGFPFENCEVPISAKGSGYRYILLNATKRTGSIHGVICVGQDITEHRNLLTQHQLVADDLRSLIETASTPIFGVDARGCITVWNRKAEEITSYTKMEVEGRPFMQDFILKSERQRMQGILDAALQGQEMLHFELGLCSKSGEERNIVLNFTPRRGRDGNVIGLIGIGQEDITEVSKQKQEAVLLAAELQNIIHSASAPIFELDRHRCITQWNNRVAEITGIPRDQVIGKELLSFVLDSCAPEVARVLKEAIEDGKSKADLEVMVESRHQDSVVLLLSCTPRMDRDDVISGAICIGQDITQMKELDVKRSNIAATVTHELRSPLHGIIGLSEQLISAGDERQKRPLIMISHCARRLLDLVTNIMDLSTLVESKRMLLARDPVHMSKLVEEVLVLVSTAVDKAKRPIKKENVQLINNVPDQLPIIEADANRCLQMLYNLVTNAFKYTKEGSVEVSASADDDKEVLTVRVRDTGIGISPASCERIFLPFEQEDQHDNRRYEGLGLGLAISREVAVKHGGNLTVESQVGEGSTFSITLPYKRHVRVALGSVVIIEDAQNMGEELDDQKSELATVQPKNAEEAQQARAKNLLMSLEGNIWVVDDDRDARRKIKEVLKDYSKANVIECESSYSCMSMMEAGENPRMILLDTEASQSMQGGCHLLRWIRMRSSFLQLPVVVISSNVSVSAMLEAVQAGCNEWIAKPFRAEELVARISIALTAVLEQVAQEVQGDGTKSRSRESFLLSGGHSLQKRLEAVEGFITLSSSSMPPMPSYDDSDDEGQSSLSMSDAEDERSPERNTASFKRGPSERSFQSRRRVTPESQALKKTVTLDVANKKVATSEASISKPTVRARGSLEQVSSNVSEKEKSAEPQQLYQRYSLESYRLLGRLLPGRSAEQLIQGKTVEPEKFHGAVLVAKLQGLDALAMADHGALGNFFDVLHTLSTTENIMLLFSAEHLVAVSGYDSPPGHETQLARFALALEERLQALRRTILPNEHKHVFVSCGIDAGEICQLLLGRLHPQVWIAGSAICGARCLCNAASKRQVAHVLVSLNMLPKIRSALPSLAVNAVDVNTGVSADHSLQETWQSQGDATDRERCYALLRPNEVLDLQQPPETTLPVVTNTIPLGQASQRAQDLAPGGPTPSVSSRSHQGASVASKGSEALHRQAQHLLLDNQQLRQRCHVLEARSQELQRSYWQVQQLAEEAQAQARRSQWEMNFWRLQLRER